jgi:hypothetical protein
MLDKYMLEAEDNSKDQQGRTTRFQRISGRRREGMKRNFVLFVGVVLAVVFVTPLVGQVVAEESQGELLACSEWLNCDKASPNYSGLCCRHCKNALGQTIWNCSEFAAQGNRPEAAQAGKTVTGETSLTGIVTLEGFLSDKDDRVYEIAGRRAESIQGNIGKEIEVKGTVQETGGKVRIDVDSYKLAPRDEVIGEKSQAAVTGCKAWQNCNTMPPNYTGTCCRECKDKEGAPVWDCKVFSEKDHFDVAEWVKKE